MAASPLRYDAIILGAGLVGMAAAVALAGRHARTPLSVALVDARAPEGFATAQADGRASAIAESSRRMLDAMGVWDAIAPNAQPIERIEVLDGRLDETGRPVLLRFEEATFENAPSAHMVENRHLYRTLYDTIAASPSVTLRTGQAASSFAFDGALARIGLADGTELAAPLVVAADGRNSPARQAAGLATVGWSYEQNGLVATVEHERTHGGVAVEQFLPAGPFAILPLPGGHHSSLVWTEKAAEAERLMALDDEGYTRELQRRFGGRLGAVKPVGPRHSYPLAMHVAKDYVAPRLALIGDAAHVLHPLAGLGFNLGLRDVAALAQEVVETARLGLDHGALDTLERYQRWRRFDTLKVAAMTDGLNRLFSNDNPLLRILRDQGLAMVDHIGPLKGFFMRQAAGVEGSQPRLLAGDPV
ncbi:FAD-dependent monooxygenase [Kaustia mangrovi]|uniref:FAD-dependent monooxygenase n=1 Tax=Kaustia mangrovi TaxID=2593653 RepID=A0A7S8C4P2_9HYPH|nr:FAD-dependent monooxygenase [Kaustia mangrovi]QPC43337.1 FAD-dependent monooxygenase [Kaustia mangrovi]